MTTKSKNLINNFSLEKTITYANITAGLSTTNYGGRLSIPSLTEVINYYNQKFPPQANHQSQQPANKTAEQPEPIKEEVLTSQQPVTNSEVQQENNA